MSWEEDLQTTNDGGDGDWNDDKSDDGDGVVKDPKEEGDEDGYDIGDDDLKTDDGLVEEELN